MSLKLLRDISSLAMVIALIVVILGAYTRLTNAGLGCPDWPGCYGHMFLPLGSAVVDAQASYAGTQVKSAKAWTEMIHRYAAGLLASLILLINLIVWRLSVRGLRLPWRLPCALILLIAFQAALGMWTVTLKLLPIVVASHLLGGMLIFAGLCYWRMQLSDIAGRNMPLLRIFVNLGIVLLLCQIAIGAWVSSNYAGIACIGFPRCNGLWWPSLHFSQGFNLFSSVGANYQGGILEHDARVAIQVVHRIGAVALTTYLSMLILTMLWRTQTKYLRQAAILTAVLILSQFSLGVANVVYFMPLWVAVMHNAIAALLLASLARMRYLTIKGDHV